METQEGVRNLARMVGTDALAESLGREERTVAAEDRALHRELHGSKDLPAGAEENDPMKIMAAGDVKVIYDQRPPAPPPEVPIAAEVLPAAKKTAGIAAKIALASAVPLAGALGYWLKPTPPPAPDADTQYELRIGPPETPGQ